MARKKKSVAKEAAEELAAEIAEAEAELAEVMAPEAVPAKTADAAAAKVDLTKGPFVRLAVRKGCKSLCVGGKALTVGEDGTVLVHHTLVVQAREIGLTVVPDKQKG